MSSLNTTSVVETPIAPTPSPATSSIASVEPVPSSTTDIMATTTAAAETTTSIAPAESSSVAESSSILSSISSEVSSSILAETTSSAVPVAPTTTAEPTPTPTPSTSEAQTTPPTVSTSTVSLSSVPPNTEVITSIVTATATTPGESNTPVTVVVTRTNDATSVPVTTEITSSNSSGTVSTGLAQNTGGASGSDNGGGLSTAGITAIAVVVPVVVVALLVLAGIFLWRKRKAKKAAEEARRKEVEDYGFNPNNDPTLPTVASEYGGTEMAEDNNGYRGWGAAAAASRKMSTTLTSGHTQGQLSETGSNPYRGGDGSDGHSGDAMLNNRRETMNSDQIGDLGVAPVAGMNQSGIKRGPSNASSTYSAAGHSDVSDGSPPPSSMPQSYEAYNPASGFGYSQHGPYGDGTYGGASNPDGMPIVQDVSARRNTRIQQPGNYQQGGIAQNF